MKRTAFATLALLLSTTICFGADRPNVLLIVSEDNGPELGCYGDTFARTPHLDRLATDGVRFENAFVPYSVCSPSRAVSLTGLYPHQNGQIGLATHKFSMYREDTANIASLLQSMGYRIGLIGKLHVNPESAFPFDFRAIKGANFNRKYSVVDYADAAAQFFTAAGDKPFFLSVNFPDAHLPFLRQANGRPKKPLAADDVTPMSWIGVNSPRIREQVANYYNCLARLDDGVGLLLAELEKAHLAENTIVIYFGDHGAQFPRGKGTVYEGGLRVPLIIRWPGQAKPKTVRQELVSTIDILPTILAAVGHQGLPSLPGRSLQPLLADAKSPSWRRYIFGFTTGSFPRACFVQHSIRDRRFKLISSPRPATDNLDAGTYLDESHQHFVVSGATADEQAAAPEFVRAAFARWSNPPRYELYDLEADSGEWTDLADIPAYAAEKTRLIDALQQWQADTRDPFSVQEHVDAYVEEQLANRDLGYRQRQHFRWSYLERFSTWRATKTALPQRNE
ncbi:MAG: sulfatase [Pirellulaceae bacterium]|jgi:N-sulfoglucosamine sulfohydrolase|nr:sulfatase [Pirellulaceae bacterium]